MTMRAVARTAWRCLLRGLGAIYPLAPAMWVNLELRRQAEERASSDEIRALRKAGLGLDPSVFAELTTVFADDVARIRRLEDKVSGQMATVSLLAGVASVIAGAAVAQRNTPALVLVFATFVWIVSAGVLALDGSRAMRLHLPDPVAAVSDGGSNELPQRLAADRLQALTLNASVGVQLGNALFAVQRSLVVAAIFVIASAIVTTAHQFAA